MTRKDELRKIMVTARKELDRIESAETLKRDKRLVGRCYRYMNSYSSGEKWPLYMKITGLDDGSLVCFEFQLDSHGKFDVRPNETHYGNHISGNNGYQPITPKEFDDAWDAMQKEIGEFAP